MMVVQLGYTGESEPMFYKYLRPLTSLDEGLYALAFEEDVRCLATLVISFKLIEVYIEHGVTALDSYIRPPRFRATIKEITDDPGSIAPFEHRSKKMLLFTWHDSSEPTKEPVCESVTPRSLPEHDYSTPCKDSICESVTPRCMPHCMLTPPSDESVITYTQLSGVQGVDTQDHVIDDVMRQLSFEETKLDGEEVLLMLRGVFKERHEVEYDLWSNGFIRGYTTWYAHGERKSKPKEIGKCSKSMEVDDVEGCTRMILDMLEADYEQAPNLHSEPLEEQSPNSYVKEYYDMLEADDEPLYEGCQKYSTLEAATRLLNWKAECNVPEATYNRALSIFKDMLPGDKLVGNFYETKKILRKLNLPREKIHACKNHCMLFYGKVDSLLSKCKVCGHSRYKNGGRNNVPNLVLTYFPIAPRLQRMYMSKKMSKEMTWHHDHKTDSNKMVHPSDGKAWKHFDSTHYSSFSREIRNVRLGLCTDGFNPNNSNSNSYSLWPVFLTIYNLPPWLCLKEENVKLSLVIPGKKNPGQNIDVFLQPLIKELKMLWNSGVETYDAYRKNNFHLKAALLWTVSDFPAYAMLSGWSTHGKLACPHCMSDVDSFQLQNGGKPCWFDCHKRFLPLKHPNRLDRKGFRAKKIALAGPPPQLTGDEIWEQIRYLPTVYEGKPYRPRNKKIDGFGLTHNWVKRSIFWELPYWHTLLIRHNLDLMHIEKNFFENLFHTIMGTLKTKDNVKARKDVEIYCDRPELHIFKVHNKDMKPKASYTLSKPQLQNVCEWMKKIKFPDGYASNIGGCVNLADYSFYTFKSHDCHVFMQRLLPIALRGMIPNALWDVITELCTFFRAICSRVLRIEDLEKLQKSIVETICKLEKIFPPGFFDSMEHLVIHLPREALLGGPKQYRWMYIYERKLGSLKRTVRNKARVEGSIVESYLVNELSVHCSLYFDPRIETRLNREPRNFALDIHCSSQADSRLNIFKVPSRRLFDTGTKRNLTNAEKHKAHTYILLNCEDVHPFLRLFDNYMMQEDPYIDEETLDRARDEKFAQWFKEHIQSNDGNEHLKVLARGPMRYVESYKGYFVNGYKFHTLKHGDGRVTHNSGEVTQCSSEVVDDNVDVEDFFQENKMPICSNTADANKNDETISLVTQGEMEEVSDLDVGDAYMEVQNLEEMDKIHATTSGKGQLWQEQTYGTRPGIGAEMLDEEAREREWQRKMDDINLMLKTFNDPRPPQYGSGLSHDESFGVDDLDLNLNEPVNLNVSQIKTQPELLVSEEPDVVEDYVSSSKDAEHGNGREDESAPTGGQTQKTRWVNPEIPVKAVQDQLQRQVLAAVGLDSNNGIYPLAFALVEVKSKSSCSDLYKDLLWRSAPATSFKEFEKYMLEFKMMNPKAHEWLNKIPPEHWASSHFSGRAKSDLFLNNICEVFNGKIVGGRDKPVITLLEYIREYCMKRIMNIQSVIDKCNGPLTPTAISIIESIKKEAHLMKVQWNGANKYQVSGSLGDQFGQDSSGGSGVGAVIVLSVADGQGGGCGAGVGVSSQVPVSETKNADGREMGDGIPTQSTIAGGASEWSFL
ncbi:uncharacterized protein Tco_0138407 [Tanacetum coccineum]